MAVHLLGIRHHGPGSARAVKAFLDAQKPDLVLVEGPPEGDALLQWMQQEGMKPPVALLVYNPENPQQASFYPFAEFSPEWQAISYAHRAGIPVRFMDLPATHQLAMRPSTELPGNPASQQPNSSEQEPSSNVQEPDSSIPIPESQELEELITAEEPNTTSPFPLGEGPGMGQEEPVIKIEKDPIGHLAEAAGWDNGEMWWEYQFENRLSTDSVFEAVTEAMTALRETLPPREETLDLTREAWMRRAIRQAEQEMFTNIAVICGAWHVPALAADVPAKEDAALLKGLPKVKTEATWVPWTYNRLSYFSGYGAGIGSPGWYHHVWHYPTDDGTRWLSQVAQLLRSKGMDTSVAHVIEAVRLAESLAALRGYAKAGLPEMNESALSILCNGDAILLRLIHDQLIVSDRIGTIPETVPRPPLQADIDKKAKTLRLPQSATYKDYVLDLRQEFDLARSVFLHRLTTLGIQWGEPQRAEGKGSFKEGWRLEWSPELSISVIEKGIWGNTLETAATAYVIGQCTPQMPLPEIAHLLERALPADLPEAIPTLARHLEDQAASSHDVAALAQVIPGLARTARYGNVRQTDTAQVMHILESLFTRVCIGLPLAAVGISEESAQSLTDVCHEIQSAVALLQREDFKTQWQECLRLVAENPSTVALLRGFAVRQLMDYQILAGEELQGHFNRSTSPALPPVEVAQWIEGFLGGSGMVLLLDDQLWQVVDGWVAGLEEETFTQVLPLLRRTFSTFSPAERQKIGARAKDGGAAASPLHTTADIDPTRADAVLPVVLQMLGLEKILV